jgi:hypothetical protein
MPASRAAADPEAQNNDFILVLLGDDDLSKFKGAIRPVACRFNRSRSQSVFQHNFHEMIFQSAAPNVTGNGKSEISCAKRRTKSEWSRNSLERRQGSL